MAKDAFRQREILTLIARYGIMDGPTLQQLLGSKLSPRWMRQILVNLESKGLLKRGTLQIPGSPSHYWLVPDDRKTVHLVSSLTGLPVDQFRVKNTHWSQYPHEALCSKVQASLEGQLPFAKVLRESAGDFKTLPDHLMTEKIRESGYLPDMCLALPAIDKNHELVEGVYRWIAVEVDRTHRGSKRLAARLNVYTRHTAFSGLLYFVPDDNSVERIEEIYSSRQAKKALRIKGGHESFLVSAVTPQKLFSAKELLIKCGLGELPLRVWVGAVCLNETHKRDNALMAMCSRTDHLSEEEAKT